MLTEAELETVVRKTILIYNRFKSPEAIAKLVFVSPAMVTISFTGSFCYSCGVREYIEDFAYDFKALTDKAELKVAKTRQVNPRTFEADYTIKTK